MRWIEESKMRKELMKMLLLSREDLPIGSGDDGSSDDLCKLTVSQYGSGMT
jgi:hypothetical protein